MTKTINSLVGERATSEKKAKQIKYRGKYDGLSCFAEMYLEEPLKNSYITPTVCTWRGVPTIDDW